MIVAEQQKFNKLQINSKTIRRLNGIRTHGPFVSVAVLYQLSYEYPCIGNTPLYWENMYLQR